MENITTFTFHKNEVRVFNQDPINPLFVATDVAKALGYKKERNAITRHCKRQTTAPKQGGGFLTLIPESDLYRLTFRSKLSSAEAFTDWVVEEVLPSIRKTGKYETPRETLTPEQQRHIQEAVNFIYHSQGVHYQTTYHSIKTQFQVGTYKDILQSDYPALCRFLGVDPIHVTSATEEPDRSLFAGEKQASMLQMTADGIMQIYEVERRFARHAQEMAELQAQLEQARIKTFDLVPYLRVEARRLNA